MHVQPQQCKWGYTCYPYIKQEFKIMSILSSHPNFMPSSRLEKSMWNRSRIGCNGVRWTHFGIFNEIPLVWLEVQEEKNEGRERERDCTHMKWGGLGTRWDNRQNPFPLQDRKNFIGLD